MVTVYYCSTRSATYWFQCPICYKHTHTNTYVIWAAYL